MGIALAAVMTAGLGACLGADDATPAQAEAGQGADSAPSTEASVPSLDASPTTEAGADSSPRPDASDGAADAGSDAGDLDAGDLDAAGDGGSPDADSDAGAVDAGNPDVGSDAEAPVVIVDGSTKPVIGFDFNDTTLVYRTSQQLHTCPIAGCAAPVASLTVGAIPNMRFTVSGPRLYFVLAAGGTLQEIRSAQADTLTDARKVNLFYCTNVQYLRAEAGTTIAAYRASMSPSGSNSMPYTLPGTPNLSRTGISSLGHCVASGCETATHTYSIVGGSIVRTRK